MFGETTISYVKIWNHLIETTIYKWIQMVVWGSRYQQQTYTSGLTPTQDASHHQEGITVLVGNPQLNLHLPLLLCRG